MFISCADKQIITMGELTIKILMPPPLQKIFSPNPQPHVIIFHNKSTMSLKKLSTLLLKYLPKQLSRLSQAIKTAKMDHYQPNQIFVNPVTLERLSVMTGKTISKDT
jgi:hypothetical protein